MTATMKQMLITSICHLCDMVATANQLNI